MHVCANFYFLDQIGITTFMVYKTKTLFQKADDTLNYSIIKISLTSGTSSESATFAFKAQSSSVRIFQRLFNIFYSNLFSYLIEKIRKSPQNR
jgi:short-subunit dehydrogenase